MIVEKEDRTVLMSQDFEKHKLSVDAEDMSHIFELLSAPYSDEIQAVLREHGTNADDEHVKHGIDRPILVTLPTSFEPSLKIRDFAKGLTHEMIINVYAKYGKSTKRDANDVMANQMNGMMGIGAKSGYCYGTKTFAVTSYVDGMMRVYNFFLDENGDPSYVLLFETESDEPSGLEISIPVEPKDITNFSRLAARVYSYFERQPEVLNLEEEYELKRPVAVSGLEGEGWRVTKGTSYAIMGNVAYPIDKAQIADSPSASLIVEAGIEVDCPLGDLALPPSREALKYTPRTKARLVNRLETVVDEIAASVEERFADANNIWDAKVLYRQIFKDMGDLGIKLAKLLTGRVLWNGIAIDSDMFEWNESGDGVIITAFSKSVRRASILATERVKKIQAHEKNIVILNDLNTGKGSPQRLRYLYEQKGFGTAYVISFNDTTAEAKFYNDCNFDTVPCLKLSDLDKPPVSRISNGSVHNPKHYMKCFKWEASKVRHGQNTEAWTPTEIDFENGTGVYVKLNRFEAVSPTGRTFSPYYLNQKLAHFASANIVVPEIYAVKTATLEKKTMGSGWVELWDYVKDAVEKSVNSTTLVQAIVDAKAVAANYNGDFDVYKDRLAELTHPDSLLRKYLEAVIRMEGDDAQKQQLEAVMKVVDAFDITKTQNLSPSFDLVAAARELNNRYPLLKVLSKDAKEKQVDAVIEYANLIDATP